MPISNSSVVVWIPLPTERFKNTCAAAMSNSGVAIVCVVKDAHGDGFAHIIASLSSVLLAQALAICETCLCCVKFDYSEVCIGYCLLWPWFW